LIDRKGAMNNRTKNDPFYKFSLIYRGSHDGINNMSFKDKCNRQVASLILIEVLQSDKIFGGYCSSGFSSKSTDDSDNLFFHLKM
jgi:hypothetical protein